MDQPISTSRDAYHIWADINCSALRRQMGFIAEKRSQL